MAKTINFVYEGNEYTLEYNRKSIVALEEKGFRTEDVVNKPMSTLPLLFEGAFYMHHRYLKKETIDEIYSHLTDKQGLIEKLAEMYSEPIQALMSDPEDGNEKNLEWKANW